MALDTPARPVCKHPGCTEPAAPTSGPGRPREYCEGRGHTRVSAWRERRRLEAAQAGTTPSPADTDTPVTMAKVTGAELLRQLRAEADRVAGIADRLRDAVETVTDPTAAEAEVEAVRAAAEQRATAAEARAAAAEQRAAEADQWRSEADAAAEETAVQLAAAQARAGQADAARIQAEADRDANVEAARADADARIAAAEQEQAAAIAQARAEASDRVRSAGEARDQALAQSAEADRAAGLALQDAARAQAAADAAVPRPAGSAPTRTRCWPVSGPTPPATVTNYESTFAAGPSGPSAKPTPTERNSPSSAPKRTMTAASLPAIHCHLAERLSLQA